MSQLTANSVLPIVTSLPYEEQVALLQQLNKLVKPTEKKPKRKRKTAIEQVAEILGDEFLPENIEALAAKIANPDL